MQGKGWNMSGGAYDYGYQRIEEMADSMGQGATPLRKRFIDHLRKVARAMHDVEWVDSGDWGEGDENDAIRACLPPPHPSDMPRAPVVLFRAGYDGGPKECQAITPLFPLVTHRAAVPPGSLVVCRYSAWPFYEELCRDVEYGGSLLINSLTQHRYIADLGNWYRDLRDLTFETWPHLDAVPDDAFPVVLKGQTNSSKWQWKHKMFANDRQAAIEVLCRLQEDPVIGRQSIYVRKYVPLAAACVTPSWSSGPPISREVRVFICDGKVLCGASYWPSFDAGNYPTLRDVPTSLIEDVIAKVGRNARFYVVDFAQTDAGQWVVVELNDGQMSGLSDNLPEDLYQALHEVLTTKA